MLEAIGLEGERVRMVNLSSAMGKQFAEEAERMTKTIMSLGPNPLRGEGPQPATEGDAVIQGEKQDPGP